MNNQYMYDILDKEGIVQDHRTIYANTAIEANERVRELRTEGETWRLVETVLGKNVLGKKDESCNIIQFTGYTKQGYDLEEWCDDETEQHCVDIHRESRGHEDISFFFDSQVEAHAFFLALCDVKTIRVDGEDS